MTGVVITPRALLLLGTLRDARPWGTLPHSAWRDGSIPALMRTGLIRSLSVCYSGHGAYQLTKAGERFGHKYSWGVIGEYTP